MSKQFKLISNKGQGDARIYKIITPEEKLKHFRNITSSVLLSAQDTWADIWTEFQNTVTENVMVNPEAEKGLFKPKCGWPEFLEKMWLLKHYLDYAQRYCEGLE